MRAIMYFLFGIGFIYIAVQSAGDTIWTATTMILAMVATLAFGVGIRFVAAYFRKK